MKFKVKNKETGDMEEGKSRPPSNNTLMTMTGVGVKVPAVENAKFSPDFMDGETRMRPLLFSHGDRSTANNHAG